MRSQLIRLKELLSICPLLSGNLIEWVSSPDIQPEVVHKFTATNYEHQLEIEEYYIQIEDTVNNGLNSKYF
jgi:hypothetical protein